MVSPLSHEKQSFLFAGQGSQYVGMGKDLYESFAESRAVFEKANEVLGFDLRKRCFEGHEDELTLTSVSQPAILTVSIAAFEAFISRNDVKPEFVAGLSLGEYSALIAAGCFSFEEGLRLVRKRGEIMEKAANLKPGKMAAVLDLPIDNIKEICRRTGAEIANINSPGQVVISGKAEAVERAMDLCVNAKAKRVIGLQVSGGFHSSLMKQAAEELRETLNSMQILDAAVPVVSNYKAKPESKAAEIRDNLISQMYSSVRWEESMRFMLSLGIKHYFEFGPGKVLKGLMRRIDPDASVVNIEKRNDVANFVNV